MYINTQNTGVILFVGKKETMKTRNVYFLTYIYNRPKNEKILRI